MDYYLFAGDQYYPRGGMHDLFGSYNTLEEAQAVADTLETPAARIHCDWWHISKRGEIVVKSKYDFG